MDKIKIIRKSLQNITRRHATETGGFEYALSSREDCAEMAEIALQALSQLETSMQSVSERSVDIPIANEELIKEIETLIKWHSKWDSHLQDTEALDLLEKCKTALSQVKPSNNEIEEIAYQLFMRLGSMLNFYGMDLDKDHAIQNLTHSKAEEACQLYRNWCKGKSQVKPSILKGRVIYLQEKTDPEYDEYTGQMWCEDDVFEKSTKFIECKTIGE